MTEPSEFTAAQAADPATPAAQLADIATHRPDLRPAVAGNPSAYPDLLGWLASFHDPAIDAAIARRSMPRGAVQPPAAGPAAQPTSGYGSPGQNRFGTPVQAVPAAAGQAFGQGAAHPQGGYGQGTASSWELPPTPQQPKRSRRGLWIGLGAAGLALVAGGAFAANALWFSKVGGAASPEAAVTQLVEGIAGKDIVSVYGVMSPAEVSQVSTGYDLFLRHMDDVDDDAARETLDAYLDAMDLELTDLALDVEELEDGLAKVTITDGSLEIDADADKLGDAVVSTLDRAKESPLWYEVASMGEIPSDDEIRDQVAIAVEELPVTVTADDLAFDPGSVSLDGLSSGDLGDLGSQDTPSGETVDPFLMVVEEDGDWYVSPYLTFLEYTSISAGIERGSLPSDDLEGAFDSPEAAAEGLVAGIKEYVATGEMDAYLQALPLADRRAASLYVSNQELDDAELDEMREAIEQLDIEASFGLREEDDGIAWLVLDSLTIAGDIDGEAGSIEIDSQCFTGGAAGEEISGCLDDIPALVELGIGDLSLVAVEEDGSWYISGLGTLGDGSGVITSNVLRLYDEGKLLDEQWWQDNLGVLGEELF